MRVAQDKRKVFDTDKLTWLVLHDGYTQEVLISSFNKPISTEVKKKRTRKTVVREIAFAI